MNYNLYKFWGHCTIGTSITINQIMLWMFMTVSQKCYECVMEMKIIENIHIFNCFYSLYSEQYCTSSKLIGQRQIEYHIQKSENEKIATLERSGFFNLKTSPSFQIVLIFFSSAPSVCSWIIENMIRFFLFN